MLSRLDSRELTEWYADYLAEPWSERRADVRAAIIAQILAEINRDRKRRPTPYRLDELMAVPPIETKKKAMPWQAMKMMLKAVSKTIKGK
jgi:hypothetical protein